MTTYKSETFYLRSNFKKDYLKNYEIILGYKALKDGHHLTRNEYQVWKNNSK